MQKFTFTADPGNNIIRHNLPPEMLIQVIQNRDAEDLDLFNDCFELFEYRGNEFIIKWLADEDELEEVEDYRQIRSILRRAWQFYKSKVHIEEKPFDPGPMETDRYLLSYHLKKEGKSVWICTDKKFFVAIKWKNKQFNETQEVEALENFNPDDFMLLAKICREMGDWLRNNHYDKIF